MENNKYRNSELAKILESEGYAYTSALIVLNRVRPDEKQALTNGEVEYFLKKVRRELSIADSERGKHDREVQ